MSRPRIMEMIVRFTLLALLLAAACAHAEPARPLVPLYDAAALTRACDEGLAAARAMVAAMEARRGPGTIFDEWNHLQIAIEDVQNPIYLLGSVHPDKAV